MATPSRPRRGAKSPPRRRLKTQNSTRSPNPIDIHVGARVRLRRNLLGLTLETLAKAVGVTYQQLQKYERGVNRVGASRLFTLGRALEVPVSFFFDEIPAATAKNARGRRPKGLAESPAPAPDALGKRETTDLVRAYWQIADAGTRKRFLNLLKAITPA
ncbi:MAG: helix-turn-helix transcriptional regulator [Alphaproteobacteria bacterium]